MLRTGVRFGIRSNHTLKYCFFCNDGVDNCVNDNFKFDYVKMGKRQYIGVMPESIKDKIFYYDGYIKVFKENPSQQRRDKFTCKSSHGRCNTCSDWVGQRHPTKKEIYNELKFELAMDVERDPFMLGWLEVLGEVDIYGGAA